MVEDGYILLPETHAAGSFAGEGGRGRHGRRKRQHRDLLLTGPHPEVIGEHGPLLPDQDEVAVLVAGFDFPESDRCRLLLAADGGKEDLDPDDADRYIALLTPAADDALVLAAHRRQVDGRDGIDAMNVYESSL